MKAIIINDSTQINLEKALSYNGEDVIYRFIDSYNISFEEGGVLFEQMKKWLWLCARVRQMKENGEIDKNFHLNVDISISMIDEMWHTFILFTHEYTKYCLNNFGYYIHHSPTTKREKEKAERKRIQSKIEANRKKVEQERKQYEVIYELLGEETLSLWYGILANEYTPETIKLLRK